MKVSNMVSITNNKQHKHKQTVYNRPKQCKLGTSNFRGMGR